MIINTEWTLSFAGAEYPCGKLPVSCLKTIAPAFGIDDYSVGENQYAAAELMQESCTFRTVFDAEDINDSILLLKSVDTCAEIYLNGKNIGTADNMHRTWAYRLPQGLLKPTDNLLEVCISSPMELAQSAAEKRPLYGVASTVPGYQHIRKPHYMYGWDWGAVIPDMGIYGSVELRRDEFELHADVKQTFAEDFSSAIVEITPVLYSLLTGKRIENECPASVTLEGVAIETTVGRPAVFEITNPALWQPAGYGAQPLYSVGISTSAGRRCEFMMGLRKIRLSREKQPDGGREFCFEVNGRKIFARGANYIPQDNIIADVTPQKTAHLLAAMRDANFNMVRVWGGGYYPEDSFYELCDQMGLLVWQDFMFACAAYDFDKSRLDGIYREACDNILRFKNHACLALWCGNNEIESMWEGWGVPDDPAAKECYRKIFGSEDTGAERDFLENILAAVKNGGTLSHSAGIIPSAIDDCRSNVPYWPSSPSTGGGIYENSRCFTNSSTTHLGDSHFWSVWHSFKPIEEFRKYTHRFCSEFGFESLPDYKTVRYFSEEDDPNICSNVMQAHQKCELGNEKLMFYMAQMTLIPKTIKGMIYASQLVQAECIKYDVEHLRRHRGISMGALYWQVNDCAPMISWSSIDYFGNKKGLHYYARRFFAPLLVSCAADGAEKVRFNVSSELSEPLPCVLKFALRGENGEKIFEGEHNFTAAPFCAEDILTLDLSEYITDMWEKRSRFVEFSVVSEDEEICRGTEFFVRPREFAFRDCPASFSLEETEDAFLLTVQTESFMHACALTHDKYVLDLSDNWFDVLPDRPVTVAVSKRARTLGGAEVAITAEDVCMIELTHCGNYV